MNHNLPSTQQQARLVDGVELLIEIIQSCGYDPMFANVINLEDVAGRLSAIAGKSPMWSWRYLRNIINHKLEPGKPIVEAALRLEIALKGIQVDIAKSDRIDVHAMGNVRPGSLILADSKPCAGCGLNYVPRVSNQRFHSDACRKEYRHRHKAW
jgi:hypothetical protein